MNLREIIDQLNEVYDGEPWFGNSISTYLQEIEPELLSKHLGTGHSIGQIISHMIAWREYVIGKLTRVDLKIEVGGENDWESRQFEAADKTELYSKFKSNKNRLNALPSEHTDELLGKTVPNTPSPLKSYYAASFSTTSIIWVRSICSNLLNNLFLKLIGQILHKYRDALGPDYHAYHNHAQRVYTYATTLLLMRENKKLAIAAAFHDLDMDI